MDVTDHIAAAGYIRGAVKSCVEAMLALMSGSPETEAYQRSDALSKLRVARDQIDSAIDELEDEG